MTLERGIIIMLWIVSLLAVGFGVPGNRRREAVIVFFATQMMTWSLSLILVELGMVEAPVREFVKATGNSFSINFIFYPTGSIFYSLYYPIGASLLHRTAYQIAFIGGMGGFFAVVERYTNLFVHSNYHWIMSAAASLLVLNAARIYKNWFFYGTNYKEGAK